MNTSSRSLVLAVALAASVAGLSGCGSSGSSSGSSTSGSDDKKIENIFFANPLPAYPDFATADACFKAALEEQGIEGTSQGPTGLQVQDQFVLDRISQATTSGRYDGLILTPIDAAKYEPFVQRAKDAGMRVVTLQANAPTEGQDFSVGTDLAAYGKNVAEEIGKMPGEQKVGIITDAAGGIGKTIVDEFNANLPDDVEVVTTGYDAADAAKTADVAGQMITAHPEMNVIFTWEGTGVSGVITGIKEKDAVGKVVGVVNDMSEQAIEGIRDGVIYGTSRQHFCDMGRLAVEGMVSLGEGETVEKKFDTGTTFVTAENLDDELADAETEGEK